MGHALGRWAVGGQGAVRDGGAVPLPLEEDATLLVTRLGGLGPGRALPVS